MEVGRYDYEGRGRGQGHGNRREDWRGRACLQKPISEKSVDLFCYVNGDDNER